MSFLILCSVLIYHEYTDANFVIWWVEIRLCSLTSNDPIKTIKIGKNDYDFRNLLLFFLLPSFLKI